MPNSMACTSPCLLLSAAMVATLRLMRTLNLLLRASCADTFMTWSWLAMAPVRFVQVSTWSPYWSSTNFWQAHCVRATAWARRSGMGAPSAWQKKFTQISPVKRVGCLCGRKLARKASGIQVRCHTFSLREGSAWTWESVAGVGKWRPKMVSPGSVGQAFKRWELCRPRVCSLRVKEMSLWKFHWLHVKHVTPSLAASL